MSQIIEIIKNQKIFLLIWVIFISIFIFICFYRSEGFLALSVYFLGFLVFLAGLRTKYVRRNLGPMSITYEVSNSRYDSGIVRGRSRSVTRTRDEIVDNSASILLLLCLGTFMIFF